ncbi:MAG TPA: glycoside hydrolase family 9 protein [Gemmatimonadaceae bacterium]|nr:glycoside hydrolase family 9 protein [Gemmatimonadaceae bacterium]
MRFPRAAALLALILPQPVAAQQARALMPIDYVRSAEYGWLRKPVLARRPLDDMTQPSAWALTGTGTLRFPATPLLSTMRGLRVDMKLFRETPAPTRSRLSSINLARAFAGEDWRAYNRLSFWIRPAFTGVPTMPIQLVMHNAGAERVPDRYDREGHHYVTFEHGGWQQVVWEIEPLARDRVTRLEIGYWINKMYADAGDHVSFEIAGLELQQVAPDHHTGWSVAPGRIAFSHSGYQAGTEKVAVMNGIDATEFELVRLADNAFGIVALRKPVEVVRSPKGSFQRLTFTEVDVPGTYVLRAGGVTTEPFAIGRDTWASSIWKTLNFFYGNRCGFAVPGVHDVDHLDWVATHGDERITMSGGWHDAGDLSQGLINTGEATYAMFALADEVAARGDDPALLARLLEEARWGLDWVLRVRFAGGNRIGFGSHNVWSNNVVGDADDRTVAAKNNPNTNYIAAAAAAIAARVLKDRDPVVAEQSLQVAEDDWEHAVEGVEGPSTWHTPAFAASRTELAGIGITASLELLRVTGKARYRDKAVELARVIVAAQQKAPVGSAFPLSGFFYTGPDRDTLFHQFHRAADQAAVVALAQLVEALPDHPDWMTWYAAVARYADYQKRGAETTQPYGVLPAYVYRLADSVNVPVAGDRYGGTPDAYAAQVRAAMPMGEGWYLRAFPVWYSRRGNYGVLLSQAKALSAASRLRGDEAGMNLAHRQAQWVVGLNPFVQSTMYGEGYDWAQQYSVSSGDFVGSLPVGMQSRGTSDLPYWPSANMYVYKEVWMHPSARWLWLMQDLVGRPGTPDSATPGFTLASSVAPSGEVTIRLESAAPGTRSYTLRTENLRTGTPTRRVTVRAGQPGRVEWRGRVERRGEPWFAVAVEEGAPTRRREVGGFHQLLTR